MSSYPPSLGGSPQAKRDQPGGLSALEERVNQIDTEISGIFENLSAIQNRLYPSRPEPVNAINDGAVSPSLENSLNRVLTHLQHLRRMSAEILHG